VTDAGQTLAKGKSRADPRTASLAKRLVLAFARAIASVPILNFGYDLLRFRKSYAPGLRIERVDRERAASHLLRKMHSLEKGLALPLPRPGFGKEKAVNLLREAELYRQRFGDDRIYRLCMAVLADYGEFQIRGGTPLEDLDLPKLRAESNDALAGARQTGREDVWRDSRMDFARFARSRSSIRIFTGEGVPEQDIVDAIDIASKSPSVCNRACARAFYTTDGKLMSEILRRQGGNRGFGHLAGGVIMVTAEMRAFYKVGERNQGWIDGGLFAMSLNYALHSKGYGVCMLNWSMDMLKDAGFRRRFKVPSSQAIVMLMVVGHIPDRLKVAVSPRRDVAEFAIPFERLLK
jgi:nitroreductase